MEKMPPEKRLVEYLKTGKRESPREFFEKKLLVVYGTVKQKPLLYLYALLLAGTLVNLLLVYSVLSRNKRYLAGYGAREKSKPVEKLDFLNGKTDNYLEYMSVISARNIFKPLQIETGREIEFKEPEIKLPPPPPEPTLRELTISFRLLGIIPGERPQAIIEDAADKKMHYLEKGQYIGKVKLKEILPDKVIFSYKNEETVLSL